MILTPAVCRERLAAADRAFLATTGEDLRPHIVPITFALTGDELIFAVDHKPKTTPNLRRLANIAWNPRVAVLCDQYDADWSALWWIRADGHAVVTSEASVDGLVAKYPQYRETPPAGPYVTITVDSWTGWAAS
ncbi:TIGR03668 family PPOX class F420-dependent oxidoreductase [Kribbella alba]|uniref:TIGR03668 family PPOX class F420-dependent oxidoreductase n=1 Tax=Kribbella alba TaxID=190197 RepID=UPI0031DE3299